MSNGTGPSRAPYIIICSGEIDTIIATTPALKIQAASNAAKALTSFYGDKLTAADTQPISDLQHKMMDSLPKVKKADADAMVAEMFALLHELEDSQQG